MSDYSNSLDIPGHFKRKFSAVWDHVLQQTNTLFASAGILESEWTASEYVWQDLDIVRARRTTGQRGGNTNPQELSGGARRGMKADFNIPVIRHKWDMEKLDKQAVPDSDIVKAMSSAHNRERDLIFVEAAVAPALGGADPYVTPIAIPNSSIVPVNFSKPGTAAANVGMTPWKLLEATRRFRAARIDMNQTEFYVSLSSDEIMQMATWADANTNDQWAKVVAAWIADDQKGTPSKLMGYNVIHYEDLPLDAATDIRTCVAFAKEGFRVSPVSHTLTIDRLPQQLNSVQFLDQTQWGACRLRDAMVQHIPCDRSP